MANSRANIFPIELRKTPTAQKLSGFTERVVIKLVFLDNLSITHLEIFANKINRVYTSKKGIGFTSLIKDGHRSSATRKAGL